MGGSRWKGTRGEEIPSARSISSVRRVFNRSRIPNPRTEVHDAGGRFQSAGRRVQKPEGKIANTRKKGRKAWSKVLHARKQVLNTEGRVIYARRSLTHARKVINARKTLHTG